MDTTTLTAATITDEQISKLCVEAGEHGDMDMVRLCRKALDGSKAAKARCAKVLNDAVAITDEFGWDPRDRRASGERP
jgi:hypothetical protein